MTETFLFGNLEIIRSISEMEAPCLEDELIPLSPVPPKMTSSSSPTFSIDCSMASYALLATIGTSKGERREIISPLFARSKGSSFGPRTARKHLLTPLLTALRINRSCSLVGGKNLPKMSADELADFIFFSINVFVIEFIILDSLCELVEY